MMRNLAAFVAAGSFSVMTLCNGCGYHLAGKADLLPRNIHTIAIPAFSNVTVRYKLSDRLATAITREFLSRTRYQVINDPATADAVLEGAVVNYATYPTIFDPSTGRASTVQMSVVLSITLRDRATGTVLFSRPRMDVRENYEISADPAAYFEESDPALNRLSRDVARDVVSAILEKF
jgi:outer membrane lipopolysaccharide assembly protein LptE/RlpB